MQWEEIVKLYYLRSSSVSFRNEYNSKVRPLQFGDMIWVGRNDIGKQRSKLRITLKQICLFCSCVLQLVNIWMTLCITTILDELHGFIPSPKRTIHLNWIPSLFTEWVVCGTWKSPKHTLIKEKKCTSAALMCANSLHIAVPYKNSIS